MKDLKCITYLSQHSKQTSPIYSIISRTPLQFFLLFHSPHTSGSFNLPRTQIITQVDEEEWSGEGNSHRTTDCFDFASDPSIEGNSHSQTVRHTKWNCTEKYLIHPLTCMTWNQTEHLILTLMKFQTVVLFQRKQTISLAQPTRPRSLREHFEFPAIFLVHVRTHHVGVITQLKNHVLPWVLRGALLRSVNFTSTGLFRE